MFIKQIYTSCLSESSYYIESNGEAAIIDPLRETTPYLDLAIERNSRIKYIFETHFHADFVSGHLDLSKLTGAPIIYGPNAKADFEFYSASDSELFELGNITLQLVHTPGHTMESSCLLLKDDTGKDHAIFTGDTLFVGDVGRPDLAVKSNLSQKDLAALLYDSLEQKIKPLADDVILYPAHGAGSSCGKNIGKETFSTIGEQKRMNYALQTMKKDVFIDAVTSGLAAPPKYFFENAKINKSGYDPLNLVIEKSYKGLSLNQFKNFTKNGSMIIDTRSGSQFEAGHIEGSISIGLKGMFAIWAASLINLKQDIVLIAENSELALESIIRLARVGIENVHGYLDGGIDTWIASGDKLAKLNSINPNEIDIIPQSAQIVDVRRQTEFNNGHVESALNFPLELLESEISKLNKTLDYFIYCEGGYRSLIAASLFKRNGIHAVTNIRGGYSAISQVEMKAD